MINLKDISKVLKGKEVLTNINLTLNPGEVTLLYGHNGSGKTMLLRMICGLISPDKGELLLDSSFKFGVIIENPTFFLNETAFYNLNYLATINKRIGDKDILSWLKIFNLYEVKDKRVKSFSLGMKQRLALCQAFMENPDVLLLDEPFNGIDDENLEIVYNLLEKEKKKKKIIVIASHVKIQVEGLVDKQIKMSNGKIV
ncbi:hypothetical protein IRB23M11_02200 [Alkalibacterium sp. m-11]|uniref:ABC transporter domain-containing protein n=1 Tax=Alkalibacterium indicireducens TaxID=398758 RepID=A0ABN1B983_9LACT